MADENRASDAHAEEINALKQQMERMAARLEELEASAKREAAEAFFGRTCCFRWR